jgi:hypothetical protein
VSEEFPWVSEEFPWRMSMVQLLRRLPSIIDNKRFQVEFEALRKYTHGVHEDDLLEAVHRMVVDLLDSGHTPSQDMLRMISGELKAVWWPDRKQHRRSKEWAFLACIQQEINFWAAKEYGNARGARTLAEQDIAESRDLSVSGPRRKRFRFRERLKKHEEELEQQRRRPLKK